MSFLIGFKREVCQKCTHPYTFLKDGKMVSCKSEGTNCYKLIEENKKKDKFDKSYRAESKARNDFYETRKHNCFGTRQTILEKGRK